MRAFVCPQCGANLSIDDEGREVAFCEYCGQRIDLADYRTVHTEHFVDEAKLKEAETDRMIRLRQLLMEEERFQREKEEYNDKKRQAQKYQFELDVRKFIKLWIKIVLALFILGGLFTDKFWDLMLLVIILGVFWMAVKYDKYKNRK